MKSPFISINGGVCAPRGFLGAGVSAGIKHSGKRDLALLISEKLCQTAGTFTTNSAKAAPVLYCLKHVRRDLARGVIANSGNANAGTGARGLRDSELTAAMVAGTLAVHGYPGHRDQYLVCSTGRIGVFLPMSKIRRGIHAAAHALTRNDHAVTEAIMTTDTFPKRIAVEFRMGGKTVRIGGMAKGAGMIEPGMSATGRRPPLPLHATMLCFLTTDAAISPAMQQACLNEAIGQSFNRITVDGDMSTNDTVLFFANGLAENRPPRKGSSDLRAFQAALNHVTLELAKMMVRDGEGISRVVTLRVRGAATAADAELAIRAIGNSSLVKTSWCGGDPNWGRILDAIGYSGARLDPTRLDISYNGIPLVRKGLQISKNLSKVRQLVQKTHFSIECDLRLGKFETILYTTDLTEKYVELNKGE
jgi:glutamate N-acetyltransferase/amino-acid N-acetyltransferase